MPQCKALISSYLGGQATIVAHANPHGIKAKRAASGVTCQRAAQRRGSRHRVRQHAMRLLQRSRAGACLCRLGGGVAVFQRESEGGALADRGLRADAGRPGMASGRCGIPWSGIALHEGYSARTDSSSHRRLPPPTRARHGQGGAPSSAARAVRLAGSCGASTLVRPSVLPAMTRRTHTSLIPISMCQRRPLPGGWAWCGNEVGKAAGRGSVDALGS